MLKKRPFHFPTDKTIRVIADTDCNCECDDQFCIAHMLFQSDLELWQVPFHVYTTMKVSFFEMLNHVYPYGKIGEYLIKHTMEVSGQISDNVIGSRGNSMSKGAAVTSFGGELWSLEDSICVGLMMNNTLGKYHMQDAPGGLDDKGFYESSQSGNRQIRVYDTIDSRFIIQDMFEKFQFYFGK